MSNEPGRDREAFVESVAQRLRAGEAEALEEVLRELGPGEREALRVRFGPVLQDTDLDDVLSEALVRLWAARERFDPTRGSLGAWFYVLARNVAVDHVRARTAGRASVTDAAGVPSGTGADSVDVDDADRRTLRELLDRLSPADRRILEYYAETGGHGSWASELADELDLKPETIRVRRLRLMRTLRAALTRRRDERDRPRH